MLVRTRPPTEPLTLTAAPLTREAFAAFGDVIANPCPERRPSNTAPEAIARGELPCGAVSANQGTAIQYRDIASMRDLYASAPSGKPASPRMTMFVCGARALEEGGGGGGVVVGFLERHPFTTQTFIPLTADGTKRYLVVVAPSLPPAGDDAGDLPVPPDGTERGLPGCGLPDVRRLCAFVATGEQAVTYGAGTWHAPMIALGPPGSTVDFVVVQFANDVPVEDCQVVALEDADADEGGARARITVRLSERDRRVLGKL
ncbi:ureidoglycolate hydrolase [Xylariaceae sp. FL1651]|nr:ureidoglycolate hydrolase [Xylariaceae sp. FL1651]